MKTLKDIWTSQEQNLWIDIPFLSYNYVFTDYTGNIIYTLPSAEVKQNIKKYLKDWFWNYEITLEDEQDWVRYANVRLAVAMERIKFQFYTQMSLIANRNGLAFHFEHEWFSGNVHDDKLSKVHDTPQNRVDDINEYLSSAQKDVDDTSNNWDRNLVENTDPYKIMQALQKFLELPSIYDQVIDEVAKAFILVHND